MMEDKSDRKMLTKLIYRLLPNQILLAAVGSINGLVSSYFATNYLGVMSMSAVGLYSPINMLLVAISTVLVSGSTIMCGKYMGRNQQDKLQKNYSLTLVFTFIVSLVLAGFHLLTALTPFARVFTKDPEVIPLFQRYMLGQSLGQIPFFLGCQFSADLLMENKGNRVIVATTTYMISTVIFNIVFIPVLKLGTFGLALASALGLWIFMAVQGQYFVSGKSHLKFNARGLEWKESLSIVHTGIPGGLSNGYQTIRGIVVNSLLAMYIGSVGISAYASADNLLKITWSVPIGMLIVCRMLFSISIGEEDRRTVADIMRVMFRSLLPVLSLMCLALILLAVPITRIFYRDPSEPVYNMTLWGIRIIPLCMPMSLICTFFVCYAQASNKQFLVHLLSAMDGVIDVVACAVILTPIMGINGVYISIVLNGVLTTIAIVIYSIARKKRFPRNMDDLMVIPDDFGVPDEDRIDISVRNMDEVMDLSVKVQEFCEKHGKEKERASIAGLAIEEMAGNIVDHGFKKDKKKHSIDIRVTLKGEDIILRIKDDCVPFDPGARAQMRSDKDPLKNIGIKTVFGLAKSTEYQNMLGLNVLTIRL